MAEYDRTAAASRVREIREALLAAGWKEVGAAGVLENAGGTMQVRFGLQNGRYYAQVAPLVVVRKIEIDSTTEVVDLGL